ncbi:MAG: ATP F0F1 synthase subunit B [Rhizobiales bacterium]|jgi:F-type H+-transporting ATPase subunit b|nr:ATP F0F1 synthase subunit B [Hyphomicrobiales bacterium]
MFEAEFWVAVATILFLVVLVYFEVHKQIFDALDARRARIQAELDEARRLKEEAQKLVAEYKAKQQEAEGEAKALIEGARAEAERYAHEMREKMDEFVARRTKMAEAKIAQAETQALADVRAAAADAAVTAASDILAQNAKGKVGDDLIARGIADVKAKLN